MTRRRMRRSAHQHTPDTCHSPASPATCHVSPTCLLSPASQEEEEEEEEEDDSEIEDAEEEDDAPRTKKVGS